MPSQDLERHSHWEVPLSVSILKQSWFVLLDESFGFRTHSKSDSKMVAVIERMLDFELDITSKSNLLLPDSRPQVKQFYSP